MRGYIFELFVPVIVSCVLVNGQHESDLKGLFPSVPVGVLNTNNDLCNSQSELYVNSLNNLTLWANEMWDSSAKTSTSILRGSVFQMGSFYQCLSARAPFPTQYCLATVIAKIPRPDVERDEKSMYFSPFSSVLEKLYKYDDESQQSRNVINVAWCVPASCKAKDVKDSLNAHLKNANQILFEAENVTYEAQVNENFCQTEDDYSSFDGVDISFCFVFAILVLLVIASTIYDFNRKPLTITKVTTKKSLQERLYLTFSLKVNFLDLGNPETRNPALKILNGIRVFCICMIITDHRFGTFVSSAILNFQYIEGEYRSKLTSILFHGDLFVDSFFIIGGILVTYGLLRQLEKKRINPGMLIVFRYIRLTPVYAFVLYYYSTLLSHTGSGPLWKLIIGEERKDCRKNWWTNLLYISNYVNADHMCMVHSWYLPCDFHFFIVAIGLCYMIKNNKKLGLISLSLVTIASLVIPFMITVVFKRPALLHFYPDFLTSPKNHPDFLLTYSKSHTRATPYFCGMFAGYIYYKLKDKKPHICRIRSYIIVASSIVMLIASILSGVVFYDPYHKYNSIESGAYASLHRPLWAIGSIGILFVASYGHGKFIKSILCWEPWTPISKLVYCAYLVHMNFQLKSAGATVAPRLFNYYELLSLAVFDIVLAFASALVLYLTVEAPFKNIFKEILMPEPETPKNEINMNHEPSMENVRENGTAQKVNEIDSRL